MANFITDFDHTALKNFGGDATMTAMPALQDVEAWDTLEKLRHEFQAVGFYLSAHPLDARTEQLEKMGVTPFANAQQKVGSQKSNRLHMAGILIRKQERVSAKSGNKFAFLQLSDATGVFEVMIFSETLARCREYLEPGTALLVNVDADTREEEIRFLGQIIEPLEAAVADVFGTFSVVVLVILMRSKSTWNASATTCATLVLRP